MTAGADKLVLVVDDDDSVREMLEFIVKKEGFRVETAVDGEDGVQKAQSLAPDLIILDLMLPRYGGFELLRQLQSGERRGVPVVVVTGRYTDRSTADLIRQESNVVEFLEKPVKPAVLGAALQKIIGRRPGTS
ncbi:MAG: response regulator [Elusimicrobiota bacterium]|nr:response regulator [Elusimicrobiota bacterium]